jgi:hypothetical protein
MPSFSGVEMEGEAHYAQANCLAFVIHMDATNSFSRHVPMKIGSVKCVVWCASLYG